MTPDSALILCRFLFYGAAIFLWGSSAYLCGLVPEGLAQAVARYLRRWECVALLLVISTTVALLPLRSATIGAGWADALDADVIRSVLLETNVGKAWMAQGCAVVLLGASVSWPFRFRRCMRTVSAALLLVSPIITGHAAMNDGWIRAMHRFNDAVHLLAGGAWLGALTPVLRIFPMLHDTRWHADARLALARFSTAGHIAVALVLVTGIANTFLIVGGLPTNWSLAYQRLLCIKILFVAGMVAIAICNRYVLVPKLSSGASLAALKWSTSAAICLGLAAVALVAWFGTLQPA